MVIGNLALLTVLTLLASSTTESPEECNQDSDKENRDICYITSVESRTRDDAVTGVSCPDGYSIVDCILVQVCMAGAQLSARHSHVWSIE